MIQNAVPTELIEKIQKLMETNGRTQAEMETATNLVNKLLLKYNLSMTDVSGHIRKDRKEVTEDDFNLDDWQAKTDGSWVMSLVNVIARHNMCQSIHYTSIERYGQGFMKIVGMAHNIEITTYIILQLITKIENLYKIAWKEYDGDEKRNTYRRGYCLGAVRGINENLHFQSVQMQRQQEHDQQQAQRDFELGKTEKKPVEANMGLMLRTNKEEITKYIAERIGPLGRGNASAGVSKKGHDSTQRGYRDGKSIQINKGVGGNSSTKGNLH